MLTNVAPYNNLSPKQATTLPFSSLRALTAPAIIPIEEKLAKDTKKMDTIATLFAERITVPLESCIIATNSLATILVAIKLAASTHSAIGIPMKKANGENK